MKKTAVIIAAIAVAGVASAAVYNDAVGDVFTGIPAILDLVSVEIQNDATDIQFTLNLVGDPTTATGTDWGKYLVAIDSVAGGSTTNNGWNRPISMSSGMDYWVGTWVDGGGGAETHSWDGLAWNRDNATWDPPSDVSLTSITTSSVTFETTLASLGLSVGDTFVFDVFTSGGNDWDGALDALSDASTIGDWGTAYDSTSTLQYTVVPEPATLGLLGMAGLGMFLFRKQLKI